MCLIMFNSHTHPNSHIEDDPTRADFIFYEQNNNKKIISEKNTKKKTENTSRVLGYVMIEPNVEVPVSIEYKLTAISQVGNKFRAYINNNWLEIGQSISDIKLIEIKKEFVLVLKNNDIYELPLIKKPSVFDLNINNFESIQEEVVGDEYE